MKKTNKLLSIILAILMIVTTIPMAFAADETPDFSDAKVITADASGLVYVDGVALEITGLYSNTVVLPEGKYKLTGNVSSTYYVYVEVNGEAVLDLNGYIWNLNNCFIDLNAPLSVYDTSTDKTGKITSGNTDTIWLNNKDGVFSLYSGTIENTSTKGLGAITMAWASVNLYGGKIKSNGYAVYFKNDFETDKVLNLDNVVLESGDGYPQINLLLSNYEKEAVIDVTDYTGESITVEAYIAHAGKFKIFEGIGSAEEAEKYTVNVTCSEDYDCFIEKEEYDEATGEKYIYTAKNAFTQQPSVDNNYTIDFNNPAATFQWYEVEENNIGTYIVEKFEPLFTYDFKAGDILKVSTDSEFERVDLRVGNKFLPLRGDIKTETIKFDADETINIIAMTVDAENPVELEFGIIKETALDGETGKPLQNPQCGKSYFCKAAAGYDVHTSDVVVGHIIASVPAKEKTCTTIGWDAYVYCTVCDYTTYNEIPASHEIETVEAKAPTCTEIGWDAYEYCTVCDYTTYAEKAALGHDIVIDAYVAPACTETGLTEGQHCSRCEDMTIAQEVIPDLGGHINEDGDTLCDRCGETILCEDCGRPVHGKSFFENLICMIMMLVRLVTSFLNVMK